jgi:hypothetical protein
MTTGTENMVPRDGLLVAAEHEGAHGVCAVSLGVPWSGGPCSRMAASAFAALPHLSLSAIISCAGDLWDREFSDQSYQDALARTWPGRCSWSGWRGFGGPPPGPPHPHRPRNQVLDLSARLYRERQLVFQ